MIYKFLRDNDVHPDITSGKKSYTSKKSNIKSISDLVNKIFTEEELEQLSTANININRRVTELIDHFSTIADIKNYLKTSMEGQIMSADNLDTISEEDTDQGE